MPRYKIRVAELAKEAELSEEDAIFFLCEAGVDLLPNDIVAPKWLARARKALELPRKSQAEKNKIMPLITPPASSQEIKAIPGTSISETVSNVPLCAPKQKVIEWRQIGRIQHIEYLSAHEVEKIHWVLVDDFKKSPNPINPAGLRDINLLLSAIHRTQTAYGEGKKYPTVIMAASALVYGLVLNHAFHNGNKRTAMVSMLVFFDKNGVIMKDADESMLYDFFLRIASHDLMNGEILSPDEETMIMGQWFQSHTRRLEKSEFLLKFHDLKRILAKYNAKITPRRGNTKAITRIVGTREFYSTVSARNDGDEIEKKTMQKIRHELQLDEVHGYDSDIFYGADKKIPEFINKYRTVLDRLAKA